MSFFLLLNTKEDILKNDGKQTVAGSHQSWVVTDYMYSGLRNQNPKKIITCNQSKLHFKIQLLFYDYSYFFTDYMITYYSHNRNRLFIINWFSLISLFHIYIFPF